MSDDSDNISLKFIAEQLKRVLDGQGEIKGDITEMKSDLGELKARVARLEDTAEETALAVANLAVSNRHIRADISKVLANQDDHEARIRRLEDHLGLKRA
jgi:chromosome segregation ATPase